MSIDINRVETFLEGKTLQQALTEERLYEIDYKILEGIPTKPGYILPSPIALFFQRNDKKLIPIGIQLFQKPSTCNPFTLTAIEMFGCWQKCGSILPTQIITRRLLILDLPT
jgi:hypothetical protein